MKNLRDLISVLRSNDMMITPARMILIQYILDNQHRPLKDIYNYLFKKSKA